MRTPVIPGDLGRRTRAAKKAASGTSKVGLVLKMFPRLSETFILNEVLELEQQALSLHIFSLKRPSDAVLHSQTRSVRSHVTYLPEKIYLAPLRVVKGQFHVSLKYPRRWAHTLRNVLRRLRVGGDRGMVTAFCQACCIIREMQGVGHLHAHYANTPAKVALLVHRITGASYSITTHAKDIFQDNPFASRKLHERMCRARFVVANSRFSAEHIRARLGGQRQIHTVYNGVDLDAFPLRKGGAKEALILSVGRLVEKKGFSHLITACQLLKQRRIEFICELVGTGALSDALKGQIRDCGVGDRIKMIGPLPQHLLRGHYERAAVFALPCVAASDGDRDILPNVLKEAMAVGVPVVTTQLDGIEELIEDGISGLLVAPGDAAGLATKLELLLNDCKLRQRLAAQARKVIEERFDRRTNCAQLKTLLLQAMQDPETEGADTAETELNLYDANCLR